MYVLLYCGVCTGVRLLPPGENPIAVRNNNNNNSNNNNRKASCKNFPVVRFILQIFILFFPKKNKRWSLEKGDASKDRHLNTISLLVSIERVPKLVLSILKTSSKFFNEEKISQKFRAKKTIKATAIF
jgi:hypothetical protein